MSSNTNTWASKIGFILSAAGSAVGLGAIWKFPYLVGANGGSAFLFPFLVFSLTMGLALLTAEVAAGRIGKGSAIRSFAAIGGKFWGIIGVFGIWAAFNVLCFYSVIGGWTLSYLFDALCGNVVGMNAKELNSHFASLAGGAAKSVSFTLAFLLATALIVLKGVSGGIEKTGKILMPAFFILVIVLIARGLGMDGAAEGLEYLFAFKPENFTVSSLFQALGFAFFSLSICSGVMTTYGLYLPKESDVGTSCIWVGALAIGASLLGGLMIIPAVFASSMDPQAGPGLTFQTMPLVFSGLPFGEIFAVAFYVCLAFAAISSSVSVLEVSTNFLAEHAGLARNKAVAVSIVCALPFAVMSALSFGCMSEITFFGKTVFDCLDYLTCNILMPAGGLLICALAGWIKPKVFEEAMYGNSKASFLAPVIMPVLRYAAPVMILAVMISNL